VIGIFSPVRRKRAAWAVRAFQQDLSRAAEAVERAGSHAPRVVALMDASVWALALLRASTVSRALLGTGLGLRTALRLVFHVDAWSDDVGGGLRLPHPFNIVLGDGVRIGEGCTIMHNVTVQRGVGTTIGDGVLLGVGSVVLQGALVGDRSMIGALSVVRGEIPPHSVAVGAPARVVRDVRAGEG